MTGECTFTTFVTYNLPIRRCSLTPTCVKRPVILDVMIAEAAYYKAEKRDFNPGHDIRDWLEAKKEIFRQIHGDKPLAN